MAGQTLANVDMRMQHVVRPAAVMCAKAQTRVINAIPSHWQRDGSPNILLKRESEEFLHCDEGGDSLERGNSGIGA